MTNYERIKAKIDASSLSEADKVTLADSFAEIANEALADIADLFDKTPTWVEKYNENRLMKIKAVNHPELWAQILEQEKKYINDLTFGLD